MIQEMVLDQFAIQRDKDSFHLSYSKYILGGSKSSMQTNKMLKAFKENKNVILSLNEKAFIKTQKCRNYQKKTLTDLTS